MGRRFRGDMMECTVNGEIVVDNNMWRDKIRVFNPQLYGIKDE